MGRARRRASGPRERATKSGQRPPSEDPTPAHTCALARRSRSLRKKGEERGRKLTRLVPVKLFRVRLALDGLGVARAADVEVEDERVHVVWDVAWAGGARASEQASREACQREQQGQGKGEKGAATALHTELLHPDPPRIDSDRYEPQPMCEHLVLDDRRVVVHEDVLDRDGRDFGDEDAPEGVGERGVKVEDVERDGGGREGVDCYLAGLKEGEGGGTSAARLFKLNDGCCRPLLPLPLRSVKPGRPACRLSLPPLAQSVSLRPSPMPFFLIREHSSKSLSALTAQP